MAYNESTVTANKDLSFASGNDTNIKGGKLSGEKVTGNVGNDLNIESKQDSNSYKENNKSVGASVGLGSNKAVSGSASVGKIDSKYESVTDQSGIYAGKEGFDIRVEDQHHASYTKRTGNDNRHQCPRRVNQPFGTFNSDQ